MGDGCASHETLCEPTHCMNHGICCLHNGVHRCSCADGYYGEHCENQFEYSREDIKRIATVAIFSAVIGVIVIALFVALLFLQIKYYRIRKLRRLEEDKEANKISKPDAEEKLDDSTSRLRIQPGYSWRQSVRKFSTTSLKVKGLSSRSVPEGLNAVGLTAAAFGGRKSAAKSGDRALLLDSCDGNRGAGGLVVRCFSADAAVVASSSSSNRKLTNGRGRPEQASVNARAVEVQVEEDTVG